MPEVRMPPAIDAPRSDEPSTGPRGAGRVAIAAALLAAWNLLLAWMAFTK